MFNDKVVLITGAAGGIGSETARLFHERGAKLALVDKDLDKLKKMVTDLSLQRSIAIQADVSNESDVESYVKRTIDEYGKIDVFFNNAGIEGKFGYIQDLDASVLDQVLDVNVKGVFYGLKHVLRIMTKQKFGSIINTSSVAGLFGSPGLGAYSASKHAVIGLTKTAALEVVDSGVRVNVICPCPVDTEMIRSIDAMRTPEDPKISRSTYEKRIPMKRYAHPKEIGELVLFLASDQASYITGACYRIDGGMAAK